MTAIKENNESTKPRGLPGMAKKIAQQAKLLEQAAMREDARRIAEHERVRALFNTASGGGMTKLVRESPILSAEDKEFLKALKYW